jgi:putative tryptophan/tyrosine transport system substrate-binding protein
MKRRDLIRIFGGLAVLVPSVALAQQPIRGRRLGVVLAAGMTPEYVAALAAFEQALEALGWHQGGNLQMDVRWSAGSKEAARSATKEIVGLNPDVVVGQSDAVIQALISKSPTTPVVFLHVADPVVSGFASNLAHPDRNITGVTNTEPTIGGKWLQLLKDIAPSLSRAVMLVNPETQPDRGALFLKPFEAAARALGVTPVNGEVHGLSGIETVMADLANKPNGAVIVIPDAFFASHSTQLVDFAERFRLPAVYPYRYYVAQGGLMSYGVNNVDLFRQAAPYVDRILRGAKPADLPIQQPTRFQLIINMKTAKALNLTVPRALITGSDEVIE